MPKDTPEKYPKEALILAQELPADFMLLTAQSLNALILKNQYYYPIWAEESFHLQHGIFSSKSILLPFATELALKAWHWRDHGTMAPPQHNLLLLFNALKLSTKELFEKRMSSLNLCLKNQSLSYRQPALSLRQVLFIHRHTFETARYAADFLVKPTRFPLLRLALELITDSYDKRFNFQNKHLDRKDCPICHLPSNIHSYTLL